MYVIKTELNGYKATDIVFDDIDKAFEYFKASERLGFVCTLSRWD